MAPDPSRILGRLNPALPIRFYDAPDAQGFAIPVAPWNRRRPRMCSPF